MTLNTNLRGRLRNTSLPTSNSLLPVFEAVVNSIHAIEDLKLSHEKGKITIEILRDSQGALELSKGGKRRGPRAKSEVVGFKIVDNGIGFTDENLNSFLTLDSDFKSSRGARGVGRLLWLKAFSRVSVSSIFIDKENVWKKRTFRFTDPDGVVDEIVEDVDSKTRRTEITLSGFVSRYKKASLKKAGPISGSLLEHCLSYFIREGGAPEIILIDEDETIHLDELYEEQMMASTQKDSFELKGEEFDLIHIKLSASSTRQHQIAYCAANRVVQTENIRGKIPGLFGMVHGEEGDFVYECYVSSKLLDKCVRSERTSFDIENEPLALFAENELSLQEIREAVLAKASDFLSEYLLESKSKGRARVEDFVAHQAPRYRPILARIPDEQLIVDPGINDRDLELLLHKCLADIEAQILREGQELMQPNSGEELEDYKERLQGYLAKVDDVKKSDLAAYVSHRKVVIDLLVKALGRDDNGKYVREDFIHELIMPMRKDSNEVMFDDCNLWLVDERLAFHNYLASDKTIRSMPITGSESTKEPDLCALNIFDNPMLVSESAPPAASLVVVELKRPMRNDAKEGEEKDPIEQALGYLDRIRQGKVNTATGGRPIPNADRIPGFCYVLCDLTPTIERRCELHDATRTADGMGYFFHHKRFNAYVEVISFDGLVKRSKERNRAFFDRLGLPTN